MGVEHIARLARFSIAGGLFGVLVALSLGAPTWAAGIGAGVLWSVGNLFALRFLIVRWIRPQEDRSRDPKLWPLLFGLLVKFPALYGIGYLLLRSGRFRIEGLVIGFVIPFAAAFADAIGRVIAEQRAARRSVRGRGIDSVAKPDENERD